MKFNVTSCSEFLQFFYYVTISFGIITNHSFFQFHIYSAEVNGEEWIRVVGVRVRLLHWKSPSLSDERSPGYKSVMSPGTHACQKLSLNDTITFIDSIYWNTCFLSYVSNSDEYEVLLVNLMLFGKLCHFVQNLSQLSFFSNT